MFNYKEPVINIIELYFLKTDGNIDSEKLENEFFEEDDQGRLLYKNSPFTGKEFSYWTNGQKASETTYVNGLMEGLDLGWFPDGKQVREFYYKENYIIKEKVWHSNGQLRIERENEFGICLWEKEWDEEGNLIKDYVINENSKQYEGLIYLREKKAERK